jgi:hypothetical protein
VEVGDTNYEDLDRVVRHLSEEEPLSLLLRGYLLVYLLNGEEQLG